MTLIPRDSTDIGKLPLKQQIAILCHVRNYSIVQSAKLWRSEWHEVTFFFGAARFVPTGMCVIHLDLTVIPDEYTRFAHRYPQVVDGEILYISKAV